VVINGLVLVVINDVVDCFSLVYQGPVPGSFSFSVSLCLSLCVSVCLFEFPVDLYAFLVVQFLAVELVGNFTSSVLRLFTHFSYILRQKLNEARAGPIPDPPEGSILKSASHFVVHPPTERQDSSFLSQRPTTVLVVYLRTVYGPTTKEERPVDKPQARW
jgi:hypothetical protein